jgi:hypothetical protein
MVMNKELPSYGFAFSPADVPRGQVFEFKLNHVVAVDDPLSLVRMVWPDYMDRKASAAATEPGRN